MRLSRFFIEAPLKPQQQISLPPNLINYVVKVLRLKQGDPLILFNGLAFQQQTGEFSAHIMALEKRTVIVEIDNFIAKNTESPLHITLLQGISRGERMDYTIQKTVELGVNTIIPLFTERSYSKMDASRLEKKWRHWQGIANSACEQSDRILRVNIGVPVPFEQINQFKAGINLLLAPNSSQSFTNLKNFQPETLNLLIGPEGGLSDREINDAENVADYQKLSLGPRVLRTETAGVTALCIVQYLWGDLG
jgi:16S rRNA (uracil1498-N3)-methyltransferase